MSHTNCNQTDGVEECKKKYKIDARSLIQELEVLVRDEYILKNLEISGEQLLLEFFNGLKFKLKFKEIA